MRRPAATIAALITLSVLASAVSGCAGQAGTAGTATIASTGDTATSTETERTSEPETADSEPAESEPAESEPAESEPAEQPGPQGQPGAPIPPGNPDIGKDYVVALYTEPDVSFATPGSSAYWMMEARQKYLETNPQDSYSVSISTIDDGWQVKDGPTFTDFVLGTDRLVSSFRRDGVSSDDFIHVGDGQLHTLTAAESDAWTGELRLTVHSIRFYSNQLQVVWVLDNQTPEPALVFSRDYIDDLQGVSGGPVGDSIYATDPGGEGWYITGWDNVTEVNGGIASFGVIVGGIESSQEFTIQIEGFSF